MKTGWIPKRNELTAADETRRLRPGKADGLLAVLLIAAFVLTLAIVELSAYLRMQEAGTGCNPWPDCYARLHTVETDNPLTPRHSLKKMHRGAASLLVLVTGLIAYRVFRGRHTPAVMRKSVLLMTGLLVILSIIGPYTPQKQYPAFATVNSVCGILLLAVIARCWWRVVAPVPRIVSGPSWLRAWSVLSLLFAVVVFVSGAWSSANYASLATTVDTGKILPSILQDGFNPLRELAVDADRRVLPDAAMPSIRAVHRLAVFIFTVITVPLCLMMICRQVAGCLAIAVVLLLMLEFLTGWLSLSGGASLPLMLGHHFMALLLMLALMKLTLSFESNRD